MQLPTQLLRRKPDTHKGDFGHILILAGSVRFSGAGVLASHAAMRSGAGLVTLGVPKGLNSSIVKIKPREVMTLPLDQTSRGNLSLSAYSKIKEFYNNIDVAVLGPGLDQEYSTQRLIIKLISEMNKALVIDADALNALAKHKDYLIKIKGKTRPAIITPHPGEMSRLTGVGIKILQKERKRIASKFARDFGLTVVLKGNDTVVADSRGRMYINKTGNPGMATAGSGDVLSGIIAAFLGQGLEAFIAAKCAVYIHGLAGDLAAKEKTQLGLIASDIIDKIPQAIKMCS